nr:hypothetical protein [Lachnospiraceae bacterium]
MEALKIIAVNYIMLAELAGLWAMLDAGVHTKRRTVIVTKIVILLILLEAILWSLEQWTQTFTRLSLARPFLTATIYILHPIIMVCILQMVDMIKKGRFLLWVPIIISAPLYYSSQWTHVIFWYNEDNHYDSVGGVMKYYPYILFFFYVIVFIILFSTRFSELHHRDRKGVIYGIVMATLGVILNVVAKLEVDYSTLFASVL